MNTHRANTAGLSSGPDAPRVVARVFSGIVPVRPVEQFTRIRGSGQYCCPLELARTGSPVTAFLIIRGIPAVLGMGP
ncbi:hypothetical protein [Methanoregula sp.]|uniref:hypothetical protein n=1 Tax=Methanoregula sp. TaxID=2052170 RepID=UPI003BB17611